ncbi:FtsX-like permease family protein [Knoellia aerolata]|uniref:ABC3 transporter permease C-terminal domain-containing protein n=1 Tax=Knoellia aerolata DSM 18566 TaxID=1385519 RepID=A0A0A0JWE2_9MICO|nr:FtsX-like permease family protein [Knoellia aerolata]KGN41755.1 hypothetical protein N801_06265 [Knoellia aerolata DSM 18566]
MTTPPAAAGSPAGAGSAWRRLTGSWAVALRMARRDVRRHRGRSALIVIMVAVPTALLTFALVIGVTSQVSGAESIPARMGNGVAALSYPQPGVVDQPFDPGFSAGSDGTRAPTPGWVEEGSAFDNAEAVAALTGTRAVPYAEEYGTTRVGERRLTVQSLALDARAGVTDKVEVVSGRLPERPTEAVVSTWGESRGLPTSGSLQVRTGGTEVTLQVVGLARVLGEPGSQLDLVVTQPLVEGQPGGGWILLGVDPVTWPEVRELNRYGFTVYSAEVLENPPDVSQLSADQRSQLEYDTDRLGTFLAIGGALLLVITTLLVGPAFAVSAARQRRTLALSASNGATTGQLRHTVLAQALVLGALAAVTGGGLGVAGAWLTTRSIWLSSYIGSGGPFEVPAGPVLLVTLTSVASAVIAALIPARRLGRLDIVGVMKGQNVSPPPSRAVFVVGLVLAGTGAFAVVSLAAAQGSELGVVLATIALVVGAIMLAPMVLVVIARLSARLPVPLRMATRDAGRQRARSVPAIAAILAGVAVLTMTLIASGSDNEQSRREYTAQNVLGDATVSGDAGPGRGLDATTLAAGFVTVRSGLQVTPVSSIATGDPFLTSTDGTPPREAYELTSVNVVPPGCTPAQTVEDGEPPAGGGQPPCHVVGTNAYANVSAIGVTTTAEIARRLRLLGHEDAVAVLDRGGVVVGRAEGAPSLLTDGTVSVMSAVRMVDPPVEGFTPADEMPPVPELENLRTTRLPAVEVELTRDTTGILLSRAMLVPTQVATAHGWPLMVDRLTVHDPAGPISQDLTDRLGYTADDDIWIEAERGFQSPLKWVVAILVGIFVLLLLVITLTSTALTLAEQEQDQATLAALGSGRGTRRAMAAAQAFTLCLIGAVLGLAVGVVPGVGLTYPLTAQSWDPVSGQSISVDPVLVFPWLVLLGFTVAVPALAAALAAAGIRRAPDATRRTA